MTIIEQIKAEIERRIRSIENCPFIEAEFGAQEKRDGKLIAYKDLLSFLSTLESEKPINSDDAMKELDEKIALVKQRGTWDGIDVDKYMDEVRGREPEKSMNLEEEINRYLREECSNDDEPSVHEIARHFAQWGAEHAKIESENPVPNDLEEAANKFAVFYDQGTCDGIAQECFIAGAKWDREQMMKDGNVILAEEDFEAEKEKSMEWGYNLCKEQMMKDAVEGEIQMRYSGCLCAKTIRAINEDKFKFGDKVRVIVLPKED